MTPSLPLLLFLPVLAASPRADREATKSAPELALLLVRDLVEARGSSLAPTQRALEFVGKRIRLLGYMVHTEEPTVGAFWVASRPVECDEGGGGTGDLPPDAVRVVLRANRDDLVPYVDGPLAITGVLEVGSEAAPDGTTSALRLVVDQKASLPAKQ